MALSTFSVFEVRPSVGSDTNGGGFVSTASGADFSQQSSKNTTSQGSTTTNNGSTLSSSATSCIVTSASSLYGAAQALLASPLVGEWLQIGSEIVKCTAASGNTLTITRGQLSTTSASHTDGATITNVSNVSTTDLVTAGSTTITSATAYFSTNVVGNIFYIAGGTASITGQWYQAMSVSTSGANTTVVLDRSTGLTTGTGATVNIGGALATLSNVINTIINSQGNLVWVKATGSLTYTSAQTFTNSTNPWTASGSGTSQPFRIYGYTSTRGDNGQVTMTTSTNSIDLVNFNSTILYVDWRNFIFSSTAGTPGPGWYCSGGNVSYIYATNCKFTGCSYGLEGNYGASFAFINLYMYNCEFVGNSVGLMNSYGGTYEGCYIHSNTSDGVQGNYSFTTPMTFNHCVIKSNGGIGFNCEGNPNQITTFKNCAIINNTSHGISMNYQGNFVIINSIIDSNGGYGYYVTNNTGPNMLIEYNNAFGSGSTANASGNANALTLGLSSTDFTLTADPFVSRSGNNFALNNTAGGGKLCRNAGWAEGTLIGAGYEDIGPVSHGDPKWAINLNGGFNG